MNCERFQTIVNDLARDLMMEATDRTAALQHADECHSCAVNLEEEISLTAGLRTLAHEMEKVVAPLQLEQTLLAAFRDRSNRQPVVVPFVSSRKKRYWAAAIAAALLIVFGIFVVRGRMFTPSESQKASGKPTPQEAIAEDSNIVKDSPRPVQDHDRSTVKTPRKKTADYVVARHRITGGIAKTVPDKTVASAGTAQRGQENVEVVTDFFPIGYSNTPNLQEGGQLLRVELPRAAVARFGLPLNMDRAGERVKADVLVGADGLAQAIRFVH